MTRTWKVTGRRWIASGAIAIGLLGVVACGSGDGSSEATSVADGDASSSDASSGDVVEMRLIAYKPAKLVVAAGNTVTWKQQDAGFHTVTSGVVTKDATGSAKTKADGKFGSGELAKGKEFTFTFDKAGRYAYFCEIHPATMSGQITVE